MRPSPAGGGPCQALALNSLVDVTAKERKSPCVQFKELSAVLVPSQTHLPAHPQHFHHQNYVEPVSYYKLANELPAKSPRSCSSRTSTQGEEVGPGAMAMAMAGNVNVTPPSLVRVRSWYIDKPERVYN